MHGGHDGSYWWAPVTAITSGKRARMTFGFLAETTGDDEAVLGERFADRVEGSSLALSRKPQVLTTTTSAPA